MYDSVRNENIGYNSFATKGQVSASAYDRINYVRTLDKYHDEKGANENIR
jgi:hypothetical protein